MFHEKGLIHLCWFPEGFNIAYPFDRFLFTREISMPLGGLYVVCKQLNCSPFSHHHLSLGPGPTCKNMRMVDLLTPQTNPD